MTEQDAPAGSAHDHADHPEDLPLPMLTVRGCIGGVLMGLANLVPGISGGTMLLASGVYPGFVGAIAEITTFRFRPRSLILLAAIGGSAALAILFLAGLMRSLVIEQRWIMYSLFIGLTLGGVPLVWRLARPATPAVFVAGAAAFLGMVAMAFGTEAQAGGDGNAILLFLAGLGGASAMVLPGVSGGYLLLVLGQYTAILGAIDQLKEGLVGSAGFDLELVLSAMGVVVPVGLGVGVGIVAVSNLINWLLEHHPKPTLGALLGLLFGAVVGLWPFQQPVAPLPGDVIKGRVVTAETLETIEVEDWRLERFDPSGGEVASALALVGLGLGATLLIDRIGGGED